MASILHMQFHTGWEHDSCIYDLASLRWIIFMVRGEFALLAATKAGIGKLGAASPVKVPSDCKRGGES